MLHLGEIVAIMKKMTTFSLDVQSNKLGNEPKSVAFGQFLEAFTKIQLQSLSLSFSKEVEVNDSYLEQISETLTKMTNLADFSMKFSNANGITTKGIKLLSFGLSSLKQLSSVKLIFTKKNRDGMKDYTTLTENLAKRKELRKYCVEVSAPSLSLASETTQVETK